MRVFVLDCICSFASLLGGLWAYGPAPGVELIPYFLGMAAWMGMALLAVLLAPFSALLRRLRKSKNAPPPAEPKNEGPADKTGGLLSEPEA
jgi:hypothetical protein